MSFPTGSVRAGRTLPATTTRSGFWAVAVMAALMWLTEMVDTVLGGFLDRFGIVPRQLDGLDGIVWAPFLHGGFGHLIANTVPFLVLGLVIALAGAARLLWVTVIIAVVGGVGTWLTGAPGSVHIGASGIVFGYAAYLITRGVFSRRLGQILLGAVIVFFWGGSLVTGFLPQDGISWQGHLFGAVGGVVAAWGMHRRSRHRPRQRYATV